MTVGPVFWGSYPGEMLEKVMAVLLAQEHPHALRRTPSSGDGGVDVLIDGTAGWHVRQIKGFSGRMKSTWRRQVKSSFSDLLRDPRLSRPIERWTLTVPIDPTSGEQAWFEELTADAPFPCDWDGEIYWHGIAARHPHVIDYYLRDGRGRVEARSEELLAATRTQQTTTLDALDVAGHLETLRSRLNSDDPHYSYEFRTGPPPPPGPDDLPRGTVLASSTSLDDGSMLTIFVIARHPYATEDAPIAGDLHVTVYDPDRGIDVRDAFEDFQRFGRAVELPDGALDGVIDAPGGLGGTLEGAGGRLGSIHALGAPSRSRLRLVDPDGSATELRLTHRSVTRGVLAGGEVQATDDHGMLRLGIRFWPPENNAVPRMTLSFSLEPVQGRPVSDVLPAVRLLGRLVPACELQWMEEHGAGIIASHQVTDRAFALPRSIVQFIDNLATVQGHVRGTVFVPARLDPAAVREVAELAQLIRTGELRGTWNELVLALREDVDAADVMALVDNQGALVVEAGWRWEIDGRHYDLGVINQVLADARLDDVQPADGRSIRLVPGQDNSMVQRFGPILPPLPHSDDAETT